MSNDPINPSHYKQGKIEVINFIEDQDFDFHIGNAIKYLCRHRHKGDLINDLKKAIWYIQRKIDLISPVQTYEQLELPLKSLELEEPYNISPKDEEIDIQEHNISTCPWHGCFQCKEIRSTIKKTNTLTEKEQNAT